MLNFRAAQICIFSFIVPIKNRTVILPYYSLLPGLMSEVGFAKNVHKPFEK